MPLKTHLEPKYAQSRGARRAVSEDIKHRTTVRTVGQRLSRSASGVYCLQTLRARKVKPSTLSRHIRTVPRADAIAYIRIDHVGEG